jgi:hypothetical protein
MIRRYNLNHPVGQPMPEDWIHLPDSVVAATDYDAISARLADEESAHRVTAGIFASTLIRADAAEARLAEAVEYGTDYKQAYGIAMANYQAALARLEEAGRVLNHVYATVYNAETRSMIQTFLRSAAVVQPERCCLDYPRCDCNSPPEPDNEWHCSQYPGCECFAGCREKALEGQREPPYARVMCREDLPVSAEAGIVADLYNELLYAVESKYPGESRHDTALRYIRDRETRPHHGPSQTVEPKP